MAHQLILGLTGQTLHHVATRPVMDASFVFEDVKTGEVIASGDIEPPSWSLVSTATAGVTRPNGARIPMAATAGPAIGDACVIVGPGGSVELFEVAAISKNSYIEATSTLAGSYPAGSGIYGVDLRADVPDDFVAGEGSEDRFKLGHPLRVTWTYTVRDLTPGDGEGPPPHNPARGLYAQRIPQLVEWVRHNVPADQVVGEALKWLADCYDDLRGRTPGGKLDRVAERMVGEVAIDLRALSIDPATFLIGEAGRALLVARILAHAGEAFGYAPGYSPGDAGQLAWAALAAKRYTNRLESLTIGQAGHATALTDVKTDRAEETPDSTYRKLFQRY